MKLTTLDNLRPYVYGIINTPHMPWDWSREDDEHIRKQLAKLGEKKSGEMTKRDVELLRIGERCVVSVNVHHYSVWDGLEQKSRYDEKQMVLFEQKEEQWNMVDPEQLTVFLGYFWRTHPQGTVLKTQTSPEGIDYAWLETSSDRGEKALERIATQTRQENREGFRNANIEGIIETISIYPDSIVEMRAKGVEVESKLVDVHGVPQKVTRYGDADNYVHRGKLGLRIQALACGANMIVGFTQKTIYDRTQFYPSVRTAYSGYPVFSPSKSPTK